MSLPTSIAAGSPQVSLAGASFLMGSDEFYPEEAPVHEATVTGFAIDLYPVTTADFAAFVAGTGYVTVAERPLTGADFAGLDPAELVPGALAFTPTSGPVDLSDWRQWWRWQPGADWRHPYGPGSSVAGRETHPVVQVAFEDATTYASWAGKRLPSEAEWEYAARGGLSGARFAWGQEMRPAGRVMANSWQGRFPYLNTSANGWRGTSPVGSFPPNGFGLHDLIGNVWEWTSDYYAADHRAAMDSAGGPSCMCGPEDPRHERMHEHEHEHGAEHEHEHDVATASAEPGSATPRRVLKGGSHLCAPEYCLRYRPAARSPQAEDTSTTHIGFRCVRDL